MQADIASCVTAGLSPLVTSRRVGPGIERALNTPGQSSEAWRAAAYGAALGGAGVAQAGTLGTGGHVSQGKPSLAPLPPAVFKKVNKPYPAWTSGVWERDHPVSVTGPAMSARSPQVPAH